VLAKRDKKEANKWFTDISKGLLGRELETKPKDQKRGMLAVGTLL